MLRDFAASGNHLLACDIDQLKVRIFDGFAIVTGRNRARGEYKGQPYEVTLRFTDVFVLRDQRW